MQLDVVKADETGVKYVVQVPGVDLPPVFTLEWSWAPRQAPNTGVDFTTDITYLPYLALPGDAYKTVLAAFNGLDDKLYRHIVEEIGNLNELVPKLYSQHQGRSRDVLRASPSDSGWSAEALSRQLIQGLRGLAPAASLTAPRVNS